jgi:hypothetical protein
MPAAKHIFTSVRAPLWSQNSRKRPQNRELTPYMQKGPSVHPPRCSICEEPGSDRIERKWKDANDFKHHTSLRQHKQACHAKAAAAAMQHARDQGAISRVFNLVSDSSKLLVLVGFMVINGLALQFFPKV